VIIRIFTKLLLQACAAVVFAGILVASGFPGRTAGADMPGTITLDSLKNQYSPVTFDHSMHAALAEKCGKCHHQHNDKNVSSCKECHTIDEASFKASAKQGFLPCSGCHSDYSPDSPEIPGLKVALHKKCFQCHLGIGELGNSPRGCSQTCHTRIKK